SKTRTTIELETHCVAHFFSRQRLDFCSSARRPSSSWQDFIVRVGQDPVFLDATRKGNIARFLNHSCAPNLYMLTV
ncbi:unnamed protein product, partial [Scytosiphon promiscuus]